MALTRKFLTALGIEAEKVDEIIQAHVDTLEPIKAERDKYKADAEKLPNVQKELDDIKGASDKDPYKVKYEAIKEEFSKFKSDVTAKETRAKKENAYKALLKECGVSEKRIDAVLRVSDIDKVEFDDEGKVKSADDIKKAIKEEWADFIQTTTREGANTATPPDTHNNSPLSKKDIMAIKDTTERQKAWGAYISNNQKG